jgi:NAD(P)-dependent dehydrogenase (short-subunit alcohol dehydrogenase family)
LSNERWQATIDRVNVLAAFDLSGTTAVVTGGGGLYGIPISEALAEAGAHVIIASRHLDTCERVASQLRRSGFSASAEHYDQADPRSIEALRDRVHFGFGAIDALVNNSVSRPMRRYEDTIDTWRESMEVNASGLFAVTRAFLDLMVDRGSGSIINIASIQSTVAPDFRNYEGTDMSTPPDYHFHKHGMIGLTRYLAAFAGPRGVRVNAISPGGLETPDTSAIFREQYCRRVFLGRLARHDDIKGAVVFLASSASAYITGQNLMVDGGYTC